MKKLNYIILVVSTIFMFTTSIFAGDNSNVQAPQSNATERVFDELLYSGLRIEAPINKGTMVPLNLQLTSQSFFAATAITATASASSKVYYGPSTTYVLRETFTTSKTVTVLEKDGSYYLIQYSVTGGTVRGYILGTSLTGTLTSVPNASNNINKLGLNIYSSTTNVYGGPNNTTYVSIGTISKREIVKVLKVDGSNWYHIEYYTSNGNKRGYIQSINTNIPGLTYDYSMPINSGTRTNDYSSTHYGIDIGVVSGTSVYAITNGSAKYRTAYEKEGTTKVMVSYGNFIELTFNNNKAYYTHLSSFANGFTAKTYANANPVRGASSNTLYDEHGTITTITKAKLLGATGNSGNSTGAHLHFEIRENGTTIVDPYKYILFAKMPY